MRKTMHAPGLGAVEISAAVAATTDEKRALEIALICAAIEAFRQDRRKVPVIPCADDGRLNTWKLSGRLYAPWRG